RPAASGRWRLRSPARARRPVVHQSPCDRALPDRRQPWSVVLSRRSTNPKTSRQQTRRSRERARDSWPKLDQTTRARRPAFGYSSRVADQRLVERLRAARRILVFTGAGVSTASGIPDYRGPNGVWKHRRPVYYDAFMSSEAARVEYWDFKLESWAV